MMYETTEEFCFVNPVTGISRPNTGKNDYDDYDDDHDHDVKPCRISRQQYITLHHVTMTEQCNF
jgi:hypothetical protein